MIYALGENGELFGSVSRLFEAPTTFEMQDDVRGGNATLDAMHGTVYEIGARSTPPEGEATRWHWDVSLYYAQIRDENLSIDDPAAPGSTRSTSRLSACSIEPATTRACSIPAALCQSI